MSTQKKDPFFTDSHMLRLRWWPVLAVGMYIAYNVLIFTLVVSGFAHGYKADPVLHAPIYWLFG